MNTNSKEIIILKVIRALLFTFKLLLKLAYIIQLT